MCSYPPQGHLAGAHVPRPDGGIETNWILIYIFKKSVYVQQEKPTTSRFVGSGEPFIISFTGFIDSEPHSGLNTLEARQKPREPLYDSQVVH